MITYDIHSTEYEELLCVLLIKSGKHVHNLSYNFYKNCPMEKDLHNFKEDNNILNNQQIANNLRHNTIFS